VLEVWREGALAKGKREEYKDDRKTASVSIGKGKEAHHRGEQKKKKGRRGTG